MTRILTTIAICIALTTSCIAGVNPQNCLLKAIITKDNDIRLDDDKRPSLKRADIPPSVLIIIKNSAEKMLSRADPYNAEYLNCSQLFPRIFSIAAPFGRKLYVAEISIIFGGVFHLILFDPHTGAATSVPAEIYSKWTQMFGSNDELFRPPTVSFASLLGKGRKQLVF